MADRLHTVAVVGTALAVVLGVLELVGVYEAGDPFWLPLAAVAVVGLVVHGAFLLGELVRQEREEG